MFPLFNVLVLCSYVYLLKMEIERSVLAHLKMLAMSIRGSYFCLTAAYTAGSHQFHQVC